VQCHACPCACLPGARTRRYGWSLRRQRLRHCRSPLLAGSAGGRLRQARARAGGERLHCGQVSGSKGNSFGSNKPKEIRFSKNHLTRSFFGLFLRDTHTTKENKIRVPGSPKVEVSSRGVPREHFRDTRFCLFFVGVCRAASSGTDAFYCVIN
jgi:hypothetical protein